MTELQNKASEPCKGNVSDCVCHAPAGGVIERVFCTHCDPMEESLKKLDDSDKNDKLFSKCILVSLLILSCCSYAKVTPVIATGLSYLPVLYAVLLPIFKK